MKTAIVTGASRGIGLELVKGLLGKNWVVYATTRDFDKASALKSLQKTNPHLHILEMDLEDLETVAEAKADLTAVKHIDLVINNSGVMLDDGGLLETPVEDIEETFRINSVGPLVVFGALHDKVMASPHAVVANITSQMGSIADNTSGGYYGYRMSKAALNIATKSLALDFPSVTFLALHPGWVKTEMGGPSAPITPQESAAGLLKVIEDATAKDSGKFINYKGKELPW